MATFWRFFATVCTIRPWCTYRALQLLVRTERRRICPIQVICWQIACDCQNTRICCRQQWQVWVPPGSLDDYSHNRRYFSGHFHAVQHRLTLCHQQWRIKCVTGCVTSITLVSRVHRSTKPAYDRPRRRRVLTAENSPATHTASCVKFSLICTTFSFLLNRYSLQFCFLLHTINVVAKPRGLTKFETLTFSDSVAFLNKVFLRWLPSDHYFRSVCWFVCLCSFS